MIIDIVRMRDFDLIVVYSPLPPIPLIGIKMMSWAALIIIEIVCISFL